MATLRAIVGTPCSWSRGVRLVRRWDLVLLVLGALIVLVALQTLWAMIL